MFFCVSEAEKQCVRIRHPLISEVFTHLTNLIITLIIKCVIRFVKFMRILKYPMEMLRKGSIFSRIKGMCKVLKFFFSSQ